MGPFGGHLALSSSVPWAKYYCWPKCSHNSRHSLPLHHEWVQTDQQNAPNPNHRQAPDPSFRSDPYPSHILRFNLNCGLTPKAVYKVHPTPAIALGPSLVTG